MWMNGAMGGKGRWAGGEAASQYTCWATRVGSGVGVGGAGVTVAAGVGTCVGRDVGTGVGGTRVGGTRVGGTGVGATSVGGAAVGSTPTDVALGAAGSGITSA